MISTRRCDSKCVRYPGVHIIGQGCCKAFKSPSFFLFCGLFFCSVCLFACSCVRAGLRLLLLLCCCCFFGGGRGLSCPLLRLSLSCLCVSVACLYYCAYK